MTFRMLAIASIGVMVVAAAPFASAQQAQPGGQSAAAAAPSASSGSSAAGAADVAHAKATFESVCSGCHEASLATDLRNTRAGWQQLVDRMFGFGLSASDAQVKEVVDYLTATYPAK